MDEIIDFNELKNKARDKDIDKFESYIYDLYYSLAMGEINMAELYEKINKYMQENNISQEKFFNIQKEMMKRYGFDMDNLQEQMKNMGIDTNGLNLSTNYEDVRKQMSFAEKYKSRIGIKNFTTYYIKNETNDLEIFMNEAEVIIKSSKKVNLNDNELNEFLCSYKKVLEDKSLDVSIFETVNTYQY